MVEASIVREARSLGLAGFEMAMVVRRNLADRSIRSLGGESFTGNIRLLDIIRCLASQYQTSYVEIPYIIVYFVGQMMQYVLQTLVDATSGRHMLGQGHVLRAVQSH